MANFRKIAKKLGLKDLGKAEILRVGGNDKCPDCGTELRLGEDRHEYQWSYCPKCQKKIKTIAMPRFQPGIKVEPHND
jgi:predicted Zn-ribbon and HTH transcriptional regulator